MSKQPKLEVVSSTQEKQENRKRLAEFLEKKLKNRREEVSKKTYQVNGGLATAKALREFIKTDAQWKFTESLGIIESDRVLGEQIALLEKKEASEIELGALTIEALYYFLTKEEGKGLAKAVRYVNHLLWPVNEALGVSKADREEINQMEKDLASLQEAVHQKVGFEGEDTIVSEIEKEIEEEMAKNNLDTNE